MRDFLPITIAFVGMALLWAGVYWVIMKKQEQLKKAEEEPEK